MTTREHILMLLGVLWTIQANLWPIPVAIAFWLRERHRKKRERAAYRACLARWQPGCNYPSSSNYMDDAAIDAALREARRKG